MLFRSPERPFTTEPGRSPQNPFTANFELAEQSECPLLTDELRTQLLRLNSGFNEDGLRVIAVAFKRVITLADDDDRQQLHKAQECGMTFVGFLVFQDPPKQSAAAAIKTLLEHNVSVKIVAGDSTAVCRKVFEVIQLPMSRVVESRKLEEIGRAHV